MKLQTVSFEQAKALRELGFPQELDDRDNCNHNQYYSVNLSPECSDAEMTDEPFVPYILSTEVYDYFRAPELELVAKWLREEHDFDIETNRDGDVYTTMYVWFDSRINMYNVEYVDNESGYSEEYVTREEALSAGIDIAIAFARNHTIKI